MENDKTVYENPSGRTFRVSIQNGATERAVGPSLPREPGKPPRGRMELTQPTSEQADDSADTVSDRLEGINPLYNPQ